MHSLQRREGVDLGRAVIWVKSTTASAGMGYGSKVTLLAMATRTAHGSLQRREGVDNLDKALVERRAADEEPVNVGLRRQLAAVGGFDGP